MDTTFYLGLFVGFVLGFISCKWFTITTVREVYRLLKTDSDDDNEEYGKDYWKPKGWRPDYEP